MAFTRGRGDISGGQGMARQGKAFSGAGRYEGYDYAHDGPEERDLDQGLEFLGVFMIIVSLFLPNRIVGAT